MSDVSVCGEEESAKRGAALGLRLGSLSVHATRRNLFIVMGRYGFRECVLS